MKQRYRISPEGRGPAPTDADLMRYRNSGKLLYNYQRASTWLHRKPLYKDPKAFLVLLLIVLLAFFLAEVAERDDQDAQPRPAPAADR